MLVAVRFARGPGTDQLLQAVGILAGLCATGARKVPADARIRDLRSAPASVPFRSDHRLKTQLATPEADCNDGTTLSCCSEGRMTS